MIYILTFDPHKVDAKSLHKVIAESTHITTWWHYLGSTYLIKTNASLYTIKDEILQKWPRQRFLILKADPSAFSGWLPTKAWDWIRRNR